MTPRLGYRELAGGGPVQPEEAYRWNLPVVTYGFDPDFVATFGETGVQAVESALDHLRALPDLGAADATLLDAFSTRPYRVNLMAQQRGLVDLRSVALAAVVQHLGLASPERYAWCLRSFRKTEAGDEFSVIQRNYAPLTGKPSAEVNGVAFGYNISTPPAPEPADAVESPENLDRPSRSTAAGFNDFPAGPAQPSPLGSFLTGLSRDDIGGLASLWATNRVVWEELPADCAAAPEAPPLVRGAPRPGVGRIEWRRQVWSADGPGWIPLVITFTDRFLNPESVSQTVVRTVVEPDIVFRVTTNRFGPLYLLPTGGNVSEQWVTTPDTSRWINRSAENGRPTKAGPGQIPPGASIAFNASPANTVQMLSTLTPPQGPQWNDLPRLGIFDGGPTPPTPLPAPTPATECLIVLSVYREGNFEPAGTWTAAVRPGETCRIEFSTDLIQWSKGAEVPATAGTHVVLDSLPIGLAARFYRVLQP
jgi:hypothetical protein